MMGRTLATFGGATLMAILAGESTLTVGMLLTLTIGLTIVGTEAFTIETSVLTIGFRSGFAIRTSDFTTGTSIFITDFTSGLTTALAGAWTGLIFGRAGVISLAPATVLVSSLPGFSPLFAPITDVTSFATATPESFGSVAVLTGLPTGVVFPPALRRPDFAPTAMLS